MDLAPIFISHRSEYARVARELKKIIEDTSQGRLDVFISEDIPRSQNWRQAIEKHLREAQSLFLIYGAPYEDWSWCFVDEVAMVIPQIEGETRIPPSPICP